MKQLTIRARIDIMPPVTATSSTLVDQFQTLAHRLGVARLQLRSARLEAEAEFERTVVRSTTAPAEISASVQVYVPQPAVPFQVDDEDEIEAQSV